MSLFGFPNAGIRYGADRTFDRSTIFPLGLVHYGDANDSRECGKAPEFAGSVKGQVVLDFATGFQIFTITSPNCSKFNIVF